MGRVDIAQLIQEVDVSTAEALAYVKYFDWKRMNGFGRRWEHYTVRAFVLSVSEIRKGYYSTLRKVKDEVLFREVSELEGFEWLKGWIFCKDKSGQWWIIVDGDSESFDEFKRKYKELEGRV